MPVEQLLQRMSPLREPATSHEIANAEVRLGSFPADYKEFLERTNGYEGPIHPEAYLMLYAVENVVGYNRDGTSTTSDHPEMIHVGGDGGGEGYFFDRALPGPVWMIALISDWHRDRLLAGTSFTDFLARQLAGDLPLSHPDR